MEKIALWVVLLVAIAGLLYAVTLVNQVIGADQGTQRMRDVGAAIRQGANAYLARQFKAISWLMLVLTFIIYADDRVDRGGGDRPGGRLLHGGHLLLAGWLRGNEPWRCGATSVSPRPRAPATAVPCNSATAPARSPACSPTAWACLGGTLIFMVYGEHAYEVLLGFGFGGTLLALFMRVGGGIYTKAADVGADLVGKVEAGIPEDDPRNAATIADNVGDNVGDCAGMAADIFESYEVTIVAAMILGYASFGHKGVIFPLLVRAIGVIGSIISTYSVKAGPNSTSDEALHSVHHGFILGSIISVVGFVLLGFGYLHFDKTITPTIPRPWERQLIPSSRPRRQLRASQCRASRRSDRAPTKPARRVHQATRRSFEGACRSGPASARGSTCVRPGPA